MNVAYEIVYVRRDRTEEVIKTVTNSADIPHIVEMPQYMGTWISESRKLLRYGRGELHIRKKVFHMTVTNYTMSEVDGEPKCLLSIAHGDDLAWINIDEHKFVGYDLLRVRRLWVARSIPELMARVHKDVAFECMSLYDKMSETYRFKNAM